MMTSPFCCHPVIIHGYNIQDYQGCVIDRDIFVLMTQGRLLLLPYSKVLF